MCSVGKRRRNAHTVAQVKLNTLTGTNSTSKEDSALLAHNLKRIKARGKDTKSSLPLINYLYVLRYMIPVSALILET